MSALRARFLLMGRLPGPVPWMGGKGRAIKKLLDKIPTTEIYCEPYGGAASLLFNREPAKVEIYNDLDNRLYTLMKVLQDEQKFARFAGRLHFSNYSLEEFRQALKVMNDPQSSDEDLAYAFFLAQNQGFGGWIPRFEGNWGRSFISSRGMSSTTSAWLTRLTHLREWHDRISRVQIDSREALEVIRYWDSWEGEKRTTFYCDPPYVLETRMYENEGGHSYVFEPDIPYHEDLVETLLAVQGAVVLSCYDHEVYEPLKENGWEKWQWETTSSAAGRKRGSKLRGEGAGKKHAARTETIYRNQKAVDLTSKIEA